MTTEANETWDYVIEVISRKEISIDDPKLARFSLLICPLPNDDELLLALYQTLAVATNNFLTERKISSGLVTELEPGTQLAKPDGVTLQ